MSLLDTTGRIAAPKPFASAIPATAGPRPISVTISVAVSITGIGRTKIYELIGEGRLRVTKVGARTLINYGDLELVATGVAA